MVDVVIAIGTDVSIGLMVAVWREWAVGLLVGLKERARKEPVEGERGLT